MNIKICIKCNKECDKYFQINNNLFECFDDEKCRQNIKDSIQKQKDEEELELYKRLIRSTYSIIDRLVISFIDESEYDYIVQEFIIDLYKLRINCVSEECKDEQLCVCTDDYKYYSNVIFNRQKNDHKKYTCDTYKEEIQKFYKYFPMCKIIKISQNYKISRIVNYERYIDNDFDYLK